MIQGIMSANSQLRSQLQHSLEQINAGRINLREDDAEILCSVHLEVLLVFAVLRDSRPGALGRCAHDAEDAHELIFVRRAGKERTSGVHLGHNAACGPDVDAGVIGTTSEEDVRGAVPESYDFVGEGVDWDTEGSRETEICKFENALVVDEEVLGFEIAVEDSIRMTEVYTLEELVHERFYGNGIECAAVALSVHVLLQIFVHVVEYQHEFVFGMNDIVKADYVLVLQLFHKRDLADCSRGCAFFGIEVDFLERYKLAGLSISTFEDLEK